MFMDGDIGGKCIDVRLFMRKSRNFKYLIIASDLLVEEKEVIY